MGLFSIDMSQPVTVVVHGDGERERAFRAGAARFAV